MASDGKYANCKVAGDGKLSIEGSSKSNKFKIMDMSAAGVRIGTDTDLCEGMAVKLKIRLIGNIVDVFMNVNGKISKSIENGYEIEFTDLPDDEKNEIDQLMRNACNISEEAGS